MRKLLLLLLLPIITFPAAAQNFSTSNIQALYGWAFDDWYYGPATESGQQATLTFEHYTNHRLGDVFFFADLTKGIFANAEGAATGIEHRIYSELHARISPLRLAGKQPAGSGFVRDVLVASEVNVDGSGFAAFLLGAGVDLGLPGFAAANVNLYYRDDIFNEGAVQVSGAWILPFKAAGVGALFTGFIDVYTTDNDGLDVHTQPQLLLTPTGTPLSFGVELYYHRNDLLTVLAPQPVLKWTF